MCKFKPKITLLKQDVSIKLTDFSDMEVSDEAKELMQVASTEFICFVTSDAIDNVLSMGRVAIKE